MADTGLGRKNPVTPGRTAWQLTVAFLASMIAGRAGASEQTHQDRAVPRCDLPPARLDLIRQAIENWRVIEDSLIGSPQQRLPWMILVGATCTWEIAPETRPPDPAEPVDHLNLEWRARPVAVWARQHGGRVSLPSGTEVAVQPLAGTTVTADGRTPYFVLALPDVWREHPAFRDDASREGLASFWLGVAAHELVHTRQVGWVAPRIEELQRQGGLPEDIDDNLIQTRFGSVPTFRAMIERELELLHRAATAEAQEAALDSADTALYLASERRTEFFHGPDEVFAEVESLFLAMEGAANWLAFRHQNRDRIARGEIRAILADYDPFSTDWVQAYGLLVYAVIDRYLPGWITRSFDTLPVSPFELLREITDGEGRRQPPTRPRARNHAVPLPE